MYVVYCVLLAIGFALHCRELWRLKRRHAKETKRLERSVYTAQYNCERAELELYELKRELEEERAMIAWSSRGRLSA